MAVVAPSDLLFQFLSTNGDGTGVTNINGDYSGGNTTNFAITASPGRVYQIERMVVTITDSTSNFQRASYGAIGGGLSTGLYFGVWDSLGNQIKAITTQTIKSNSDWANYCYDTSVNVWSGGEESLHARWTFSKSGSPIFLDGDAGEYLGLIVEDDLTGLDTHYFQVQGIMV